MPKDKGDTEENSLEERVLVPGDVIFVNSTAKFASGVNRFGQAVVRGRVYAPFSHVALSLGADMIGESLTKDGVRTRGVQEFLIGTDIASARVFRPTDPDKLVNLQNIFSTAQDFYGRSYNWRFLAPMSDGKRNDPLFCSEFVAHVFLRLGYREFKQLPAAPLPIDLVRICRISGWKEFTLANLISLWLDRPRGILDRLAERPEFAEYQDILRDRTPEFRLEHASFAATITRSMENAQKVRQDMANAERALDDLFQQIEPKPSLTRRRKPKR
jgi:uncharacterized protein YycO